MFLGIRWILLLCAATMAAQQVAFVRITGPNAPKGATALFEDKHGGIWMGGHETGAEGLTFYDGVRFVPVLKNSFPKVLVVSMAEDSEGGIWIASSGGLYRLFSGHLERKAEGSIAGGICEVAPDVFLASVVKNGEALLRIMKAGGTWKVDVILSPFLPAAFRLLPGGQVLYPCPDGFCEFSGSKTARWIPGKTPEIIHHRMPNPPNSEPAKATFRDSFGCVWMRSKNETWYQCPGDTHPEVLPSTIAGRGAGAIAQLNDGSVVIGTFSELAIGRPGRFRVISALNGYPSVAGFLVRKDDSIWLDNANGLFAFSPHLKLEYWTERDGLGGNTWSVLPAGRKTFAIAGEEVVVLDEDRARWQKLAELSLGAHLASGPGKTLFAGTQSAGVMQMTWNGKILRKSSPIGASMLARTSDGQLWVAGSEVANVSPLKTRLVLHPANIGINLRPAKIGVDIGSGSDMKVDRWDNVWACGSSGLLRKDSSGWHVISTSDGLRANNCGSFAVDQRGDVWYSYADDELGFSLIEHPGGHLHIRDFSSGGDIGTATGHFFGSDRRGWLWRGASDGVYVADTEQARRGEWLHLDRGDGLPGIDTNRRSFVEDDDGSVWFGVDNSVIHINPPDDLVHPYFAPQVFVSAFSWEDQAPKLAAAIASLPHGSNVVAHIGSLQFERRNSLRLRYRMLPEQSSWRESRSFDLQLGSLSSGTHTLEVQGRVFTGPWSQTASRSFTVLRAASLSWPLLVSYFVAATILATAMYLVHRRRVAEEAQVLPDLKRWRLGALLPDVHQVTGTLLDSRFEVGNLLARGGFANVMDGYDRRQKQRCAIKIFRSEVKDKAWIQRGFEQEVAALQTLKHPNVVSIYAHGRTPFGAPYLVMEFIGGRGLRNVLDDGPLTPKRTARLLSQLAAALEAIHAQGIWHRDVKPENIIVRNEAFPEEQAVLIDFSIAIVKDANETLHGLSRAAGSFDYMAPEQAIGYAEPSSDVFSLAKVVIEMLTGHRLSFLLPNASIDLPAQVRNLLRSLAISLSEDSIDSLATALEFDPSRRSRTATDFAGPIVSDLDSDGRICI